jgi:hypothetical protein
VWRCECECEWGFWLKDNWHRVSGDFGHFFPPNSIPGWETVIPGLRITILGKFSTKFLNFCRWLRSKITQFSKLLKFWQKFSQFFAYFLHFSHRSSKYRYFMRNFSEIQRKRKPSFFFSLIFITNSQRWIFKIRIRIRMHNVSIRHKKGPEFLRVALI